MERLDPVCPWHDAKLRYVDLYGCWQCPECGGQWYPADDDEADESILTLWRDEQRYKRMLSKPGSGSRSAKRKVVKPIKKPWLYET